MKKSLITLFALGTICCGLFAQQKKTAEFLKNEALKKESVLDSIEYLKNNTYSCGTLSDKRSILYLMGTLQEQLGLYSDATKSYAQAAGIAAEDAKNMRKVTSEQLVIDATRASLCAGDWERAESFMRTQVRNTKNDRIRAHLNLYAVWSNLCKAENRSETRSSITTLKQYLEMNSMKSVRPAILLTLWYLTNEAEYSNRLKSEYPKSPETGIAKGDIHIMRVPFWYFVPRENGPEENINHHFANESAKLQQAQEAKKEPQIINEEPEPVKRQQAEKKFVEEKKEIPQKNDIFERTRTYGKKQQLGMFSSKTNAEECVKKARNLGFDAYYYKETKTSGKTYFIIVVDEDSSGTIGNKLKKSGLDCYPIND